MSQSHALRTAASKSSTVEEGAIHHRIDELERQFEAVLSVVAPGGQEQSTVRTLPPAGSEYSAVRRVLRARRARARHFHNTLFGEPAWDMLLELYAAHLAQRRISISSLCKASETPTTTGLRWITALEQEELACRRSDPLDGRRVFIELTEKGEQAMKAFFRESFVATLG